MIPVCDREFDDVTCGKTGDHRCVPRGNHIVNFFAEMLCHTKGKWAKKPFILTNWQENDIIRPLFETVFWSDEHEMYVRRYQVAWIELARKQGKSELLAGIALYLLVADGEEGAEVYGCALDRDQARKVFDVADRMVNLSGVLSSAVAQNKNEKRLIYYDSASYYQALASDVGGNLGHNPHGIVFDEVLTQKDSGLWDAMRTGMGTRTQPLMVAATTAGFQDTWAYEMHKEMVKVQDEPSRSPHVFVYLRNTPEDADPYDEANWTFASPALGQFFNLSSLRNEANEALNDPTKEVGFKIFRLNQWSGQTEVWMPMHLFDASTGPELPAWSDLAGRDAFGGLDMSSTMDLTSWCLLFPPDDPLTEPFHVLWRYWITETSFKFLNQHNNKKLTSWVTDGYLKLAGDNVLDYETIYTDIAADGEMFNIRGFDGDEMGVEPAAQRLCRDLWLRRAEEVETYNNTAARMTPGLSGIMGLVKDARFWWHGNPVTRWCFEFAEVRFAPGDTDRYRVEKPDRRTATKRIDGVPAAVMAFNAWHNRSKFKPQTVEIPLYV